MTIITRAAPQADAKAKAPHGKPPIDAEEIARRRKAVEVAFADNRIEGLLPNALETELFDAFARGEIELRDIRARLCANLALK